MYASLEDCDYFSSVAKVNKSTCSVVKKVKNYLVKISCSHISDEGSKSNLMSVARSPHSMVIVFHSNALNRVKRMFF